MAGGEVRRPRVGDSCDLHRDVLLQEGVVEIRYGRFVRETGEYDASRKDFPNANAYVDGGCVVHREIEARVVYCEQCRRARALWMEQHARPLRRRSMGEPGPWDFLE